MSHYEDFKKECESEIASQGADLSLKRASLDWFTKANARKYSYHFEWMGRPIIQYPQDILAMQEIIFSLKPDLIIETGIAHGGSLIFSSSMLELNAACGGPKDAEVVAVDIDIREHNRAAIEAHPMAKRITMIQGSSISKEIVDQVRAKAEGKKKVLVCLDSNHTHDHVLEELKAYAPLTSIGSYCVVFDTIIEHYPKESMLDRSWSKGNSPKSALNEYLKSHPEFVIDSSIDNKIQISVAPSGFLKKVA